MQELPNDVSHWERPGRVRGTGLFRSMNTQ